MSGIGIMLARLLGPHAFGTYAVAYVALVALLTFNELGVSLAIVRWPGEPSEIVPTVATISLLVSVIIYAGCFFAAPAYASAMGAAQATTVIRVLALAVLSDGLTNTPAAVLQRNFRQGQRTIADQANVWLGTSVTVALAWSGYGAMSLAVGRLIGCIAGAVLLLVFAPESLRLGFNAAKARALLRFGLPLAGANIIAFGVATVDQVVVGHVLGPVALGFYVLALNLANWPIAMFSQPVRTVGPAVFARLQHDDAAMRTTFLSAAGLLCSVALPFCMFISGSARPLIGFAYGARWLPAAQPLMWLALLAAVQVFFLLAYDFFVVLVRSRFLLTTQLVWLLALVPALAIGARADGIYGASLAEFAVAACCVLPWYLAELAKAGIRPRSLSKRLLLPSAGAALAGLVDWGAAELAPGDLTALAVGGTATCAVVGLLVYRMRSVLALVRPPSAEPLRTGTTNTTTVPPAPDASIPTGACTEELSAVLAAIDAPSPYRHEQDQPAVSHDGPHPRPACAGLVASLRAHGDILGHSSSRMDLEVTSPLYRKTVASLFWDPAGAISWVPAEGASRSRADGSRAESPSLDSTGLAAPLARPGPESSGEVSYLTLESRGSDTSALRESALADAYRDGRKLTGAAADVRHDIAREEQKP